MPQPTILLKAREPQAERSVSPKRVTKESESSQSTSSAATEQQPTPTMTRSIKLVDDGTFLYESANEYLQDSTDFLVVGVLGFQGTGKSSILNLLASSNLSAQTVGELLETPESDNVTKEHNDTVKILTDSTGNENKTENKENVIKGQVFLPQTCEQIQVIIQKNKLYVFKN